MVRSCCAEGCTLRDTEITRRRKITFHRFPLKNSEKLQKWIEVVHRKESKEGVPWVPTGHSCLCSRHFTPDCFDRTGQTVRLRDFAIPSIFFKSQKQKSLNSIPSGNEEVPKGSIQHLDPVYLQDHQYHLPTSNEENKDKTSRNSVERGEQSISPDEGNQFEVSTVADQRTQQGSASNIHYGPGPQLMRRGWLCLYCVPLCPHTHRTRLVLEHKKIPYETININPRAKPDWFLKRNPFGLVPVLEQDSKIVHESLICNDYLDEAYPDIPLGPTDPYVRAKDKMLIGYFDRIIRITQDQLRDCVPAPEICPKLVWLSQMLEQELEIRGKYFGGELVGMLDFNIWPWFECLDTIQSVCGLKCASRCPPKLSTWKEEMFHLPAVKATMLDTQQRTIFLKNLLEILPKSDVSKT